MSLRALSYRDNVDLRAASIVCCAFPARVRGAFDAVGALVALESEVDVAGFVAMMFSDSIDGVARTKNGVGNWGYTRRSG
jgi:hypothetical protein